MKQKNFAPSKAMLADEPISEMESIKTLSLNNAFSSNQQHEEQVTVVKQFSDSIRSHSISHEK